MSRTRVAFHIVHCILYVSTKHIAYFSLLFFCCFSLFSYLYVGILWPWAIYPTGEHVWSFSTTPAFESILFMYLCYCTFILLWHLLVTFYSNVCIFLCFWRWMFTTSWWVVNISIVVIFPLCTIILITLYPSIEGVIPFILLYILYPSFGGVYPYYHIVVIYCFL